MNDTRPKKKKNNQYYPDVKPESYNKNLPGKICQSV